MIRNPKSQENATITVITVDKKKYIDCDVPPQPFGQEGMVQFWFENKLVCIPLTQVFRVEINFNE